MARLEEIRKAHADSAEFLYVYIKEAHPADEWQMDSNERDDVVYEQPKRFEDRLDIARTFVAEMDVETPTLVDDLANTANACYAAWPERIYIVGTDGRIALKGGLGPFHFDPEEIVAFLDRRAS